MAGTAYWLYRLYSKTFRYVYINDRVIRERPPTRKPLIFAYWHEDDLAVLSPHGGMRLHILISLSGDGDKIAYAAERFGYCVFRGSSTRGGARGLIGLIRAVSAGNDAVVTIDGPRGPRHVAKPGIALLASKTGASIMPVAAHSGSKLVFRGSWSRMYLPWPFTRVTIQYADTAIPPPESDEPSRLELCRIEVEQALIRLHRDLDRRMETME